MSSRYGFPGHRKRYAKFYKSYENPPPSPALSSAGFLVRVCLAMVLLPLDVLFGNCLRSGDWTRPVIGGVGITVTYYVVYFFTTAGPNGGRIQQRTLVDRKRVYRPIEVPHWVNLCNLDGFPGASLACPHYARRARQLYDDGSYDVSELANGMRVLRVNGEVYSSYDPRNGRLGDEYARMVVDVASGWKQVTAGGQRPVRILLLGLGGGSMVAGLHHRCHGRSTSRHRRASAGVVGCAITAVDVDEKVTAIARRFFLGVDAADVGMDDEDSVRFVTADAADFVKFQAQEGGFDVIINDVYDQRGVMPPSVKEASFYNAVRRLLGAGGVYIVNVIAPAFGPGSGRGDLSVATAAMRSVFGKKNVDVKRTGPALPVFPQNQLVVGTKRIDKKISGYYNFA